MKYQVMPELSAEEYELLKSDIEERGVLVPIEIDESGNILDGYHRKEICDELGIKNYPTIIRIGLSEDEKRSHARKLNLLRRHLNGKQKRELISGQLKETPEVSDRQIAETLGTTHPTVASVRGELEDSGALEKFTNAQTSDGRQYPRKRKKPASIITRTQNETKKAQQSIESAKEKAEKAKDDQPTLFTTKELKGKSITQAAADGDELTDQQARMVDKFKRLEELTEQGVYLGSIWSFENRADYAGDASFHGNCAPQVMENAILRYTEKSDLVLDPMAGSGTILNVCEVLSRKCRAFDLSPKEARIQQSDARDLPLSDEVVDFIFWHPPYWNMVKYSNDEQDISNTTWEQFLDACRDIIEEFYRIIKSGKYICVLSGDKVQDGEFYPVSRKLANILEDIGFIDCGVVIKPAHNTQSQIIKGKTIFAELAFTGNIKVEHDIISIWKRPDSVCESQE